MQFCGGAGVLSHATCIKGINWVGEELPFDSYERLILQFATLMTKRLVREADLKSEPTIQTSMNSGTYQFYNGSRSLSAGSQSTL